MRAAELRFSSRGGGESAGCVRCGGTCRRTEGWAAGLQLAALSLRGHDDAAGFVAAFTGSHRYVLDYLADVLEALRAFLLETSVLERLSGRCPNVRHRPRWRPGAAGEAGGRACS